MYTLTLLLGPSHWKDSYPGCGGKRQSPVSIKTDESEQQSELEEFVLTNYDNTVPSLTLTNNGDRGMISAIRVGMMGPFGTTLITNITRQI